MVLDTHVEIFVVKKTTSRLITPVLFTWYIFPGFCWKAGGTESAKARKSQKAGKHEKHFNFVVHHLVVFC